MSVTLHVGMLDEMRRMDEDGFAEFKRRFGLIREMIRSQGHPTWEEPTALGGPSWWTPVVPSNGIAFLQRFAAYLDEDDARWPTPGDPSHMSNPLSDPRVADASSLLELHPFQHLILHSPREGYWVPVDFRDVVFLDRNSGIGGGGFLGSSVRLLQECEHLARLLGLPLDVENPPLPLDNAAQWSRFPIESYNLRRLHQACRKSLELGAAIVIQ